MVKATSGDFSNGVLRKKIFFFAYFWTFFRKI